MSDTAQPPKEIRHLMWCVWASFILLLSTWIIDLFFPITNPIALAAANLGMEPRAYMTFYIAMLMLRAGIIYFILAKVRAKENWARILCLLLCISQIPLYHFYSHVMHGELNTLLICAIHSVLHTLFNGYAVYLLLTSPGKDWFKKELSA